MSSGTAVGSTAPQPRRAAVGRPVLFGILSAAQRIVQISAPAGSGKTFLLRSWLAETELVERAAWVTVTAQEADPQTFWLSVLDAVRTTVPCSGVVRDMTPAPDLDWKSMVGRLLEDLGSLEEPVWLIFDDLHELLSSEAADQLGRFIARAPDTLRVVLSARRDMQLGLHRLRLEGELTEIRAADLRFTLDEARAMFEAAGIHVSDTAVQRLVARTEGWAAGLRLAALSMARHPDPERFAADFSGSERMVAEYLLAEVLARQPPHVSALLLRTSILERVSGPLAARLTGIEGAERILAELEEAGAFVVALDPQRTWYRYHRLLGDLLALELRRTAAHQLPALHTAAAEWFAEHGHPVDAIRHALAAEEWTTASHLLADHWFGLYLDGRRDAGRDLLKRFPPSVIMIDPELALVAAAEQLADGSLPEAERYLAHAAGRSAAVPAARHGRFQVALSMLRLSIARAHNDIAAVAEQARRFLLPGDADAAAEPLPPGLGEDLRALALCNLGIAEIWTGRRENAERHLEQAMIVARRHERPLIELAAMAHSALVIAFRSPALGEERSTQAIELADTHGWSDQAQVGVAHAVLGTLHLWRGQLDRAERSLDRAAETLRSEIEPATGVMLHNTRAQLALIRGEYRDALAAFETSRRLNALLTTHWLTPIVEAHLLICRIKMGDLDHVASALAELDHEARETLEMRVVRAALELGRNRPDAAISALDVGLAGGEWMRDTRWGIHAHFLEALAHDAARDAGGATRALEQALELAEPDGQLLPFLMFPAPDLLERHLRLRTAHASLIAEILNLLAGGARSLSPNGSPPSVTESLSDSELRVLRYLPTNLQAPEIAAELFVSVNTVRTHLRHVYTKLGVHRRAEAVGRARELGLLSPSSGRS